MDSDQADELARQLWAIGDIARIRILQNLPLDPDCSRSKNVSELAELLGMPQPTVSHHLRVLRQAGLVMNRKMCRDVYYWIDREAGQHVLQALGSVLSGEDFPAQKIPAEHNGD